MNRISRGRINAPPSTGPQLRRGRGASGDGEESLDLFSRSRRGPPTAAANESDVKLERAKSGRNGADDLFSTEVGKHDYDWLLTPPGTPLYSSSEANEHHLSSTSQRSSSNVRSFASTKASRFSVAQSENNHSTRPAKTSSTTMSPSISNPHSSNYCNNSKTSVLNTSSASVTSRPSTPSRTSVPNNSSNSVTSRPSTPGNRSTTRPVTSRPSTPAKSRPVPNFLADKPKPKPAQNSRPSTPNSRSQIPINSITSSITSQPRSNSRPSTPTRHPPAQTQAASRSPSVGRASIATSRTSSPALRARTPAQPVIPPGFPLEVPPNLKTKLPERPISAGRQRPGTPVTVRANSNSGTAVLVSSNRRQSSSPVSTRGRLPPDESPKRQAESNGHEVSLSEAQKKSINSASVKETTGFGRSISKKSFDMAVRHMDIRQGIGGIRGASLFPQSIRSAAPKGQPARTPEQGSPTSKNGATTENGNYDNDDGVKDYNGAISENGGVAVKVSDGVNFVKRVSELGIYESSRYDAILLKEDSRNMNWLLNAGDKSDQSPLFDHRFEPLPEPFMLI